MVNRVEGLDRLKARLTALSAAARAEMLRAHNANADEFMAKVAQIVPRSNDPDGVELADTLEKVAGQTETGVKVQIGGAPALYPAHLELGHMGPGGKKVDATPFWYPAKRVLKKRHRGRSARALNKAIKMTSGGV